MTAVSLVLVACEKQPAPPGSAKPSPSANEQPTPPAEETATPAPVSPSVAETPAPAASPAESTVGTSPQPGPAAVARPRFTNPAANEYLDNFDAYLRDFQAAFVLMQRGDMSKFQAMTGRAKEIQERAEQIRSQLSPEEQKLFQDYIDRQTDELGKATGQ